MSTSMFGSPDLGRLENIVALNSAARALYAELGIEPEASEARLVANAIEPIASQVGKDRAAGAREAGMIMGTDGAIENAIRLCAMVDLEMAA